MMEHMQTSLFNLQEISLENHDLLVEFYAGDLFDIYSDILVLSAFRGGFAPIPGTTWGSLHQKLNIGYMLNNPEIQTRISENMVAFSMPANRCFSRLYALEMVSLGNRNSFTLGTLRSRYRELGQFLEQAGEGNAESISMPLLGTGNQGISLQDSVTELLDSIAHLKTTRLKIIRIFAHSWQAIGSLNLKINSYLQREEASQTPLLQAAIEEARTLNLMTLSEISRDTIRKLISLSEASHGSFTTFGIAGRHFAERITSELYAHYDLGDCPDTLHLKLVGLTHAIIHDRPYVLSYLRLLQNYGNQAAHAGNHHLTHQDVSAIIIAIVRIIDYYESTVVAGSSTQGIMKAE